MADKLYISDTPSEVKVRFISSLQTEAMLTARQRMPKAFTSSP